MASILTLDGPDLGRDDDARCRCHWNKRTKRYVKACFVGKSKKHRNGWKFVGTCRR